MITVRCRLFCLDEKRNLEAFHLPMQELHAKFGKPLKANTEGGRHPITIEESLVECVMDTGELSYEDRCLAHHGVWHEQGHLKVSLSHSCEPWDAG